MYKQKSSKGRTIYGYRLKINNNDLLYLSFELTLSFTSKVTKKWDDTFNKREVVTNIYPYVGKYNFNETITTSVKLAIFPE